MQHAHSEEKVCKLGHQERERERGEREGEREGERQRDVAVPINVGDKF